MVVLLKGQVPAALAGLALTYAAHISGVFQYTIRLLSETESRFISVERMQTAIQVPTFFICFISVFCMKMVCSISPCFHLF